MWIEKVTDKRGNTSYKYSERYINPKTNRHQKISVTYPNKSRDTQKEAANNLNARIDQLQEPTQIIRPTMTFHQLVDDEWFPIYSQQVRESTYLTTKNIFNGVKEQIPANYLLSKITTTDLNNLFEYFLYKKNLSNKYVSIIKSKLNQAFIFALKKQYILVNPVEKSSITYKREEKTAKIREKFLEDDEYSRLIEYTMQRNQRYGLLFQWMYLTGMRCGEATALQKDDIVINELENYAVVSGTLEYRERKISEVKKSNQTKTPAGMRNVDLPGKAIDIISEINQINHETKSKFLFCTSVGTPIVLSAINTFLRKAEKELEIDKSLSSHIFRHTHISKLAELGVPLYVIQERVGHEKSDITEKIYLHITKNVKKEVKNQLEKL